MNILHISPNFNYTCGVSKYLTIVLSELKKYSDLNLFFITNGGDSLERLEKIGLKPFIMKFDTGIKNLLYMKKNLKELENFCRLNKIDIIHTHHRYPEFLAYQLKHKLKITTVTTVHSLVKGLKGISFKSDKIIAVSKAVEKNLIENFDVPSEKIIQLYNPIELNYEKINEGSELTHLKNFRVILFIGRNHPDKGLDLLLKAFDILSKKYSDIALVILSEITKREMNKISHKNKRVFIFPPQSDVGKFYSLAELVVLPSKVESFPYIMLESGYFKKIFVGSDVGGVKEFIENEKNGLLFESENLISLVNTLDRVINLDSDKRNEMAKNLFDKVINLDSPSKYVEKLIKIYKQNEISK